jgi:glucose-6-phosphate isomerase
MLVRHMADGTILATLVAHHTASRIHAQDASLFAPPGSPAHASVSTRLGWVTAPRDMASHLPDLEAFTSAVRTGGLTDVYLLGMGGSSLCAEVLRDVSLPRHRGANLVVLDTTDERTVQTVTDGLSPERALFIVASKSGSTIEVSALERHFWSVMSAALGPDRVARHFVAITDPGTSLAERAGRSGYLRVFLNPPDIGGRFSALSLFGLVPAALVGLSPAALLASGARMAERSAVDTADNPGLALGVFMGSHAADGRDKLTVLLPPSLAPLGVWIEQLVAESTGKEGRGVLPVVDEPVGAPSEYGQDRVFVVADVDDGGEVSRAADALAAAGRPVFRIPTSVTDLGGEFYRWEMATAVAGRVLGVNPFDEPNVRDAKTRTGRQLDTLKATGSFQLEPPLATRNGRSRREHRPAGQAAPAGRYAAILDYLPADATRAASIARLRATLRQRTGWATTYGVGPRYLHSTGQYHKGGPNTGVFLLVTATDQTTTPVPGEEYSFHSLKQAQALGDFDALVAAGRPVVHCHVEDPSADLSAELARAVGEIG